VVERRIPFRHITIDLFNFIDVVAITEGAILGIQVTSTTNAPARVKKITGECALAARDWLRVGGTISVWGFAKRGKAGKRKLWVLKEYPITQEMVRE
jgi:hypothetical protein